MPDLEKIASWYDDHKMFYDAFAKKMQDLLKTLVENENIPFHSITYRLKEKNSYLEKCNRKNYDNPIEEITDFAGIRIIAYTTADVDKICSIIESEFLIDELNSENKADLLESDKVGYLSVHYIAGLSENRLSLKEYSRYIGLACEIQVRTLLQHAWAEIEHDRSYKFSGVLPENINRRFHLIAGVLEMMDSEFQRLSDEIDQYAEKVRKETECGNLNIPLDTTSLIEYISNKISNPTIIKNFNQGDKEIINELHAFGINSIKDLESLFSPEFCKFYNEFEGYTNYLGLLRSAMVLFDAKLYFEKVWNEDWMMYSEEEYKSWDQLGIDTSIVKEYMYNRPLPE